MLPVQVQKQRSIHYPPCGVRLKKVKKGPEHIIRDFVVQQEIYPIIQCVTQERCVEMIDLYHPFLRQGKLLSDGVHPNKEGNLKLAQLIFEKLREKEIGQ